MPSGGHNAKPLAVLRLEGTHRPDRHAGRGPKLGGEPLRKPEGLGEAGGWLWDEVTRTRGDWLCSSDAAALESLCICWHYAQQCRTILDGDATEKNARVSYTSYMQLFNQLAQRFGITPADRARLGEGSGVHEARDELEDMLA